MLQIQYAFNCLLVTEIALLFSSYDSFFGLRSLLSVAIASLAFSVLLLLYLLFALHH